MIGSKMVRVTMIAAALGLMLPACATKAMGPEVTQKVAPGVEVVKFDYRIAPHKMLKKYKKGAEQDKPVLVFDITLKNTSDKPARYQAFMLMPNEGKSTGGIIPRSAGKTLEAGQEASENYAALLYEMPASIQLVVETID